jgi:hypothetical protein
VFLLYDQNKPIFIELIEKAKERYQELQEEKANKATKDVQNYKWEVPLERIYNELYDEKENTAKNALEPYYEYKRASKPEVRFAEFLEEQKENLHWWYKNGEKAKEHFKDNSLSLHKNLEETVTIIEKAAWSSSGVINFIENDYAPGCSFVAGIGVPGDNTSVVEITTIDNIVNELIDMFIISTRSNKYCFTLGRFYNNLLKVIPEQDYEHIHEAFLTEV